MEHKPTFLITMGDPAGIGAEIIVKSLSTNSFNAKLIVVGDKTAMFDAINFTNSKAKINLMTDINSYYDNSFGVINLISLSNLSKDEIKYKQVDKLCGDWAFKYVVWAIDKCNKKEADGIITGPINKESLKLAGHNYSGHTEILADYTETKNFGMLLSSGNLNVIHVTTHCSLSDAVKKITTENVYKKIKLGYDAMQRIGIKNPRIAVAGLNPHASEDGLFGSEEKEAIIPAIELVRKDGIDCTGPYPSDTVFVRALGGQFDLVVAMYHDQGHIAVKLCGFRYDKETKTYTSVSGINITVGIPFIRTSVDHGTAFGKAGEGRANEQSMTDAVLMAIKMFNSK